MRLVDFIETSSAAIVAEAVVYARTLPPLANEPEAALRDHVPKILEAIVSDLKQAQSRESSRAKALGNAPVPDDALETAAQTHGRLRAKSGLHTSQLVAEYRALRASVLRLWADTQPDNASVKEVARFNEAIDQAIAESVDFFADEMDQLRNLFLGVVAHDLRGPLNAILLTSELISRRTAGLPEVGQSVDVLMRSGRRMAKLLDTLLEYNKSALGIGMRVQRSPVDLAAECAEELEILTAALPRAKLMFRCQGDLNGEFDASAVREAMGNLVYNAAAYGDSAPIGIELEGLETTICLRVSNEGTQIPEEQIAQIFQPLKRGAPDARSSRTNLGLGLFIVDQIARAHGGDAHCTSSPSRTVFSLLLPRRPPSD
ncbi:ATP-binding protein [Variovorax sp. ZT4R33]|uniref:ATP-binding protein n=1 Tax=Variovorax sp. ZT4R33 TaxID=3443743 RepID=UPI003F46B312